MQKISPRNGSVMVDFFGEVMVSKGVISLRNDIGTSYGKYIAVQNELAAAVNELRNALCMQRFGRKYDDLDPLERNGRGTDRSRKKSFPDGNFRGRTKGQTKEIYIRYVQI